MPRVEPLLVEIKFFEAVYTSEGHFGISDLGLLLKVVESLLDVWLCSRLPSRVEWKFCLQVGKSRIPGRAVTRVWVLLLNVNYGCSVDEAWN